MEPELPFELLVALLEGAGEDVAVRPTKGKSVPLEAGGSIPLRISGNPVSAVGVPCVSERGEAVDNVALAIAD
jgi:hypothetical protein